MEAAAKIVVTLDRSRRRTRAQASSEPAEAGRVAERQTRSSKKGEEVEEVRANEFSILMTFIPSLAFKDSFF